MQNPTYNHACIQNKYVPNHVRVPPSDPAGLLGCVIQKEVWFLVGIIKLKKAKHSEIIKQGHFKNPSVNWCKKFLSKRWDHEKHSCFSKWLRKDLKAVVYFLSLVEMRKSMCNLSSYLCIWRSARQWCHDLFYGDEAWCQNLCLAAKPHVKWPGGGLCVILWIAISSHNITQRENKKKQSLGQKTHMSYI